MSIAPLLALAVGSLAPAPVAKVPATRVFSPGHAGAAYCLAFSPDGTTLASGGRDGTVLLWDVATGKRTALTGHAGPVFGVAFSPDGKTLVAGSGRLNSSRTQYLSGEIKVWDVARRQLTQSLQGQHTGRLVRAVAFSPDGKLLASAGQHARVNLWDVTASQLKLSQVVYDAKRPQTSVATVAFSPDGKLLAWGDPDFAVTLWDVAAGRERASLKGHAGHVNSVSFSPDGKTLASAGFDYTKGGVSIKLWEVSTATQLSSFDFTYKQTNAIHSVVFDPTGRFLFSGSNDGEVKKWDLAAGKVTSFPRDKHSAVYGLRFSPGGRILAASRWDGSLVLWDLSAKQDGK